MLAAWAVQSLQEAVNQFLRLDQNSPQHLQALAGKSVAINILPFDVTLYWQFTETEVLLSLNEIKVPDVIFTGTPIAFTQIGLSREHPMRHLLRGDVRIHGDTTVAQAMQHLLTDLDIDWEEHLSAICGDTIAHQAGKLARRGKRWVGAALSSLRMNVTEYLQEESRQLPSGVEVRKFLNDVDEVRMATDRLTARVKNLTNGA